MSTGFQTGNAVTTECTNTEGRVESVRSVRDGDDKWLVVVGQRWIDMSAIKPKCKLEDVEPAARTDRIELSTVRLLVTVLACSE